MLSPTSVLANGPVIILPEQSWLYIPDINVRDPIDISLINSDKVHDTTTLGQGVMRLQHTSWEDISAGRTVLIGHGNGVFKNLHTLESGAYIAIISADREILEYEVYHKYWTEISDVSILETPTNVYELVLITCSIDESHRLVVRARFLG